MEKLNPNLVALSMGVASAILYILCLIVVAITPIPAVVSAVNALQHSIDVSGIVVRSISLANSIIGIIGWFVIAAVTGYVFAFTYNLLAKSFK
ncbi:hypothetical protein HYX01_00765 [Candidatus Woesearchaeota archaeon]|nr:hypothetical protein [Candidatus Woesearchaeota archaeon]